MKHITSLLASVVLLANPTAMPVFAQSRVDSNQTRDATVINGVASFDEASFARTFTHHTAAINGVRLHYVMGGKGDPVVLLHGFPETWYSWHKIMPALAERYTVIAVDLRGLGDSEKLATGYDKKTIASDIYQLMRQLGYTRIFLVGQDWGGNVAYSFAAAHPESVSRLAILESALPGVGSYERSMDNSQGKGNWFPVFHQLPDLPEKLVQGRERIYLDWFYDNMSCNRAAIDEAARREYARTYSAPNGMRVGFMYYRTIFEDAKQVREDAKRKLKMPVLALGGVASLGTTVRDDMQQVADNVRGEAVERCGHWMQEECADAVLNRLLAFFSEEEKNQPKATMGNKMRIGQQAFEHWQHGAATGNWEPFIAMLTDDVVLKMPLPEPHKAEKRGKEQAATTLRYVGNTMRVRVTLTPVRPPTISANTVVFEILSQGTLEGKNTPIRVPFVVAFDVRGDKIAGVREYIGDRGV